MYLGAAAGALVLLASAGFASAQIGLNVDVEQAVREHFADAPVMVDIARCESKFRQYTDSGNVLHGGLGGAMVGVYQIHSDVHANFARSIGYDIYTLDGNLGYARHLYLTEGTRPWVSSFQCWGAAPSAEAATAASIDGDSININLSLGMQHQQVLVLQKRLNTLGFTVATEGPGSPGNETTMFGALTRAAVRQFQCAQLHICDGDEYSTGYGYVGARTRSALASAGSAPVASDPAPAAPASDSSSEETTGYSQAEQEEIARLREQIGALKKRLAELLAARSL
ncbi:MAG TPA: peptidoglycan-binding domain-containing protein [Candidatus Paceibacterota bacterium]|nr:peptidoglycan-binding domain-containing protein [Candidatus Paceibacterota bacterium]